MNRKEKKILVALLSKGRRKDAAAIRDQSRKLDTLRKNSAEAFMRDIWRLVQGRDEEIAGLLRELRKLKGDLKRARAAQGYTFPRIVNEKLLSMGIEAILPVAGTLSSSEKRTRTWLINKIGNHPDLADSGLVTIGRIASYESARSDQEWRGLDRNYGVKGGDMLRQAFVHFAIPLECGL